MKIVCEVWKKAGKDGLCEIEEVALTMDEILDLAMKKAMRARKWSADDIYTMETKHLTL